MCQHFGEEKGVIYSLAQKDKTSFHQKYLNEPFSQASCLHFQLNDIINSAIVGNVIHTKQDAINYIDNTFFYKKLKKNLQDHDLKIKDTPNNITEFLSKVIDDVFRELSSSRCIFIDEKDLSIKPTTLGIIAAIFNLSYKTAIYFTEKIEFNQNNYNLTIASLIEILCEAKEFDKLPIRHNEEILLSNLASYLPFQFANRNLTDPHLKANILILCYLLNVPIPNHELAQDSKYVIAKSSQIIQGMIEICKFKGFLNTVLSLISISRIVTRCLWVANSQLLQIDRQVLPTTLILNLKENQINYLPDLLAKSEANLIKLLGEIDGKNAYQNLKKFHNILIKNALVVGENREVHVLLNISVSGEERLLLAKFNKLQVPLWYIIVGNESKNTIYQSTLLTLNNETKIKFSFTWTEEMKDDKIKIYILSDSYFSLDQVIGLDVKNANVLEKEFSKEFIKVSNEMNVSDIGTGLRIEHISRKFSNKE